MSFFPKIRFRSAFNPVPLDPISEQLKEKYLDFAGVSRSGVIVTSEISLRFSAVWCAVRLLSEIPASLPRSVVQISPDGSFKTLDSDPVAQIFNYPNSFMTGFDFHELMNSNLQLHGNALAVIFRDRNSNPLRVIPVAWSGVSILIENGELIYTVNDQLYDIHGKFYSDDVIHYKILSVNGIVGRSPIRMANDNIGLALSAENYGSEYFRKGGNHKAVIETQTGFKSYTEYAAWREKYDKEHSGMGSDHGTPILQPGMQYKQLTMSMQDAQFLATRQFQITDIARWYNLPPHMISDLTHATFSNIEHQDLQFIKYTLRGLIRRQEEEWEYKLLTPARRKNVQIRFNIDGIARGDMRARSQYIVALVNSGIMTPNEGRSIETLPPKDGHDDLRVPQNITGKPIIPLEVDPPEDKTDPKTK